MPLLVFFFGRFTSTPSFISAVSKFLTNRSIVSISSFFEYGAYPPVPTLIRTLSPDFILKNRISGVPTYIPSKLSKKRKCFLFFSKIKIPLSAISICHSQLRLFPMNFPVINAKPNPI